MPPLLLLPHSLPFLLVQGSSPGALEQTLCLLTQQLLSSRNFPVEDHEEIFITQIVSGLLSAGNCQHQGLAQLTWRVPRTGEHPCAVMGY